MVFDSRSAEVAKIHRGMVQILKEKRAEAHFAGTRVQQTIQVYDWAVPAHATALRGLGLSAEKVPSLCLVTLNGRGLPESISWQTRYQQSDQAIKDLDEKLGIAGRDLPKTPPVLVLVGLEGDSVVSEADAKLVALRKGDWQMARLSGVEKSPSLDGVPTPGLALLDSNSRKVLWTRDLTRADSALQALAVKLGMAYKIPDQIVWPTDGTVLLRVPGGTVTVGRSDHGEDCPTHHFNLNEPYYYMGRTEVTVAQFRKYLQAKGNPPTDCQKIGSSYVCYNGKFRSTPKADWEYPRGPQAGPAADNLPATHISLNDAMGYCAWAGLRLPTEREWEHAAGTRNFPWGDEWNSMNCRNSAGQEAGASGGPAPVGSYPGGASPFGLLDMAGNAYEWTSSAYLPYLKDGVMNSRMHGLRKVVRGGSYGDTEVKDYWVSQRVSVGGQATTDAQGFRVCLGGPQEFGVTRPSK